MILKKVRVTSFGISADEYCNIRCLNIFYRFNLQTIIEIIRNLLGVATYLTQCAAVKTTRGRINEPPHWKTLSVTTPVSSISFFKMATIHGNCPKYVFVLSKEIKTYLIYLINMNNIIGTK